MPDSEAAQRARDLIRHLLREATFDGAAALRAQVDLVEVETASATLVRFGPTPEVVRATAVLPQPLPVLGEILDSDGEPVGLLHLWSHDGVVSMLEQDWFTDEPREMPDPSCVVVQAR